MSNAFETVELFAEVKKYSIHILQLKQILWQQGKYM